MYLSLLNISKLALNRTSAGIISILPTQIPIIRSISGIDGIVGVFIPTDSPTLLCADEISNKESTPPYPYDMITNQDMKIKNKY